MTQTKTEHTQKTPWGTVFCISLAMFVLIAAEFMPVALLTPIADHLGITEGQAGQAIAFSGLFAVLTSLFGSNFTGGFDRRAVLLFYTLVLIGSGLAVTFAPNYQVFMLGRALIGMAIGGYISLTPAVIARIVPEKDVAKALSMLQGGSALAAVVAQPMGSYLGGMVGWRGAFFVLLPLTAVVLVGQAVALPKLPSRGTKTTAKQNFMLLGNRRFAIGMVAMMLFFVGQFALSTYLRPFLENITALNVNQLSAVLLSIGIAGFIGTTIIPFALKSYLFAVLGVFPIVLGVIALGLVEFGANLGVTVSLLILWGLLTTPTPAAWTTWMTRVIPEQLEEGGAMFVALIQFAIMAGAFSGGLLFDRLGWWSPFVFSAVAFGLSATVAVKMAQKR